MKKQTVMVMRHSGSHLILPIVREVAVSGIFRPKGEHALDCEPVGRVIVFTRNPRNRIVSHFRWKGKGTRVADDVALARFLTSSKKRHGPHSHSPISFMTAWARRWIAYDGALLVRFEDLVGRAGVSEVQRIATFLDRDCDEKAIYRKHYRAGTFTGQHSDWREWFGPASLLAYESAGGLELDRLMGYDNA